MKQDGNDINSNGKSCALSTVGSLKMRLGDLYSPLLLDGASLPLNQLGVKQLMVTGSSGSSK